MAQPNVVREPSMDEILASIRRIIESNEPAMQESSASSFGASDGYFDRPANDDVEEVTLTVDDTFAGDDQFYQGDAAPPPPQESVVARREPQPRAQPQSDTVTSKPLSLADVAARVRAASERSAVVREPARQPASPSEEAAPIAASEKRPLPVMAEPVRHEPQPAADRAEERAYETVPAAPAYRDEPVAVGEAPVVAEPDEAIEQTELADIASEASADTQAVSLLSYSSEERVARSFQDLALAIDVAERRSFDEIAEEMLRPMLQEWLDDNLPTLVERLVREEIERVARGPRR